MHINSRRETDKPVSSTSLSLSLFDPLFPSVTRLVGYESIISVGNVSISTNGITRVHLLLSTNRYTQVPLRIYRDESKSLRCN